MKEFTTIQFEKDNSRYNIGYNDAAQGILDTSLLNGSMDEVLSYMSGWKQAIGYKIISVDTISLN